MLQATMRRLKEARATDIEGEGAAESGFTLIELMVVLLIIAILLAIAIPTFLGVTNTAGDRAAQSNLTNALTEAKALYQVSQSYSTNGVAYTPGQFTSQAPEFTWQTTACTSSQANCVDYLVFNVAAAGDGQGLALAVASAKTNTCWYAYDLEATPSATIVLAGNPAPAFPTAGVWYAKSASIGTGCAPVSPAAADTHFTGLATGGNGTSYANAPVIS
jgi:prepilin-type N-terminal cleavage/methylation domain-containing protein